MSKKKEIIRCIYYLLKRQDYPDLFKLFDRISFLSTKFYNHVLSIAREWYDFYHYYPSVEEMTYMCTNYVRHDQKMNDYKKLQEIFGDDCASLTLRKHYGNIEGYVEALKAYYIDSSQFTGKPEFPHYVSTFKTKKIFSTYCKIVQDGSNIFLMPFSRERNAHNFGSVLNKIPFPLHDYLRYFLDSINKRYPITFIPLEDGNLKIMISYEDQNYLPLGLAPLEKALSIDLGTSSLMACISSDYSLKPLLFSGKELQCINAFYFKQKRELQRKMSKCNDGESVKSKRLNHLELSRKRRIRYIFNIYASFLMKYCLFHKINKIIIGENKGWKQNLKQNKDVEGNRKFSKKNTRNFTYIPHNDLKNIIKNLCEKTGIIYQTQEESYTSQTDNLIEETLEFHPSNKVEGIKRNLVWTTKEGKEVKLRSLFKSRMGIIHSDINGALGILRKVEGDVWLEKIRESKLIFQPCLILVKDLREKSPKIEKLLSFN